MNIINNFEIENETFYYYDINKVINNNLKLKRLPIVLKILLESNLRCSKNEIEFNRIVNIFSNRLNSKINFYASRVVTQNFTGISTLVDLTSLRNIAKTEDINKINPQLMVDLIIDQTLEKNSFEYDKEIYEFVKWAGNSFSKLRVIPPGSGISNKINFEYLSTVLHLEQKNEKFFLYPETIISTDSKTEMFNSFGVLALPLDGIDILSTILGLPLSLELPKVLGVNICGNIQNGVSSFDLIPTLIKQLEEYDVKGQIVEFYGEGLKYITLEDRSTILSLASKYNATCAFFAIDDKTISYFNKTRDTEDYGNLIKIYLQKQSLYFSDEELDYDETMTFDLSLIFPKINGPKKIQDFININSLKDLVIINRGSTLEDMDIVLAEIYSSVFKSNPHLLIHAALIAKKSFEFGIKINKNVNANLYLDSSFIVKYLEKLGLLEYFNKLGFNILIDEMHTPLNEDIKSEIKNFNLNVCSISSMSNKFEKQNEPIIKSNYLMSPSLVIIYSLFGTMKFDIYSHAFTFVENKELTLFDLWPDSIEYGKYLDELDNTLYKDIYKNIFEGNEAWNKIDILEKNVYEWHESSTYLQGSKFIESINLEKIEINNAGILALLSDSITTEQISFLGQISLYSSASKYLEKKGVKSFEYNTFENRRANSEIMIRGILHNNVKNQMVSKEGGYTMDYESGEIVSIHNKAEKFKNRNRPLVLFAGSNYGKGRAKDWAVKGMKLLGVKAIIAKSFDEVHRSNLITLGILPLEFLDDDIQSLKLKGSESININADVIKINSKINMIIVKEDLSFSIELKSRLDTEEEVEYYKKGGTISFLLEKIK